MVDAVLAPGRNVVDFANYRQGRAVSARHKTAQAMGPLCRHCGAALGEGERDDDCSSAGLAAASPAPPLVRRRFFAE